MSENTPAQQLTEVASLNERISQLTDEMRSLSAQRQKLVHELQEGGYSHARIGKAVGLSASRIWQILHDR